MTLALRLGLALLRDLRDFVALLIDYVLVPH